MSEEQLHPLEQTAASGTHITGSKREFARGRWIVRWVSLLYSLYFFVKPAYGHSLAVWMEFAVLYAAFLILYVLAAKLAGRGQIVAFAAFFLVAFLYYSRSEEAYGVFAYPTPQISLISTNCSEFSENLASSKLSRLGVPLSSFYLHSRQRHAAAEQIGCWMAQHSHQLVA
jgi:hypothetical protein